MRNARSRLGSCRSVSRALIAYLETPTDVRERSSAPRKRLIAAFKVKLSPCRARALYERHGFLIEELTDGARNEEKMPDVTYHSKRP